MKWQSAIGYALVVLGFSGSSLGAESQKSVVIHAGQLFDGKSDRLLSKQVFVIQGDRIADARRLTKRRKIMCTSCSKSAHMKKAMWMPISGRSNGESRLRPIRATSPN